MTKKSKPGDYGYGKIGKNEYPLKKDGSYDKRFFKGSAKAIYEKLELKKKALTEEQFKKELEKALGIEG